MAFNCEKKQLEAVTRIAPGKRAPTLQDLTDGGLAVSVLVESKEKHRIMDELAAAGAVHNLCGMLLAHPAGETRKEAALALRALSMQAAEALGWPPEQVFKTLMTLVDGAPACVVAPSDREVGMKKLAAAFGAKSAQMMKPADAERLTGFKVGGVSPFGQRKRVRTALDETAVLFDRILINAGQRGLLLEIAPEDARRAVDAVLADLTA